VFVADQEHLGGGVLAETARWMIGVLRGARPRSICIPEFPDFAGRCIGSTEVRCACVESTEDQLSALCRKLSGDFCFHTSALLADQLGMAPGEEDAIDLLPQEIRDADLLVTSMFHAATLRTVAARLDKPLVVIRLNPEIIRRLQNALADGEVTVVHVDPRFPERLRLLAGAHAERIRSVLARDRRALTRLDRSHPMLISPAARDLLRDADLPPSFLDGPLISSESADELIELLIRFNLEAVRERA
jgi:hypothetical protein